MIFNKLGQLTPAERVRQDPPTNFTHKQQQDRAADELVGVCRGMLSDGAISSQEALFLKDWIDRNAIHAVVFSFDIVYRQLQSALADGVLDEDEECDLLSTLVNLVGGEHRADLPGSPSLASALPLCQPPPHHRVPRLGVRGDRHIRLRHAPPSRRCITSAPRQRSQCGIQEGQLPGDR